MKIKCIDKWKTQDAKVHMYFYLQSCLKKHFRRDCKEINQKLPVYIIVIIGDFHHFHSYKFL